MIGIEIWTKRFLRSDQRTDSCDGEVNLGRLEQHFEDGS